MLVKIDTEKFLEELSYVQNVVEKKTVNPILSNVLIKAKEGGLELRATNLQIGLISNVEAEVEEAGEIAVDAKKLYEIVRSMPEGEVTIRSISANQIELVKDSINFRLLFFPAEEFPPFPEPKIEVEGIYFPLLREMIKRTYFAINPKETRFFLNGALMEIKEGKIRMVTTDSHRLSYVEKEIEASVEKSLLLPKKVLTELQRMEEETIAIGEDERNIYFRIGNRMLNATKVEGKFPEYEPLLHQPHPHEFVTNREVLLEALKRAAIMVTDSSGVKFEVGERKVKIIAVNPDLGEMEEEIETDYAGEKLSISFNHKFLIEFLNSTDADLVKFSLRSVQEPIRIEPIGEEITQIYIVMPLRV